MEGPPSAQGEDQVTIQPTSQPMNPLRRRMLEDMATRGLRQDTQRDYIRFVRSFAGFLRRPPDTATSEDIRRFQVHQAESGVQPQSINCSVSALRFFFTVTLSTLDRPDLSRRFILVRYPRKLPTVLSVEEVGRLLEMAPGPKYRAAPGTAYGAGLRVSEVAALKRRYRQHAHAHPGRAGLGPQCHAVAAAVGTAAA